MLGEDVVLYSVREALPISLYSWVSDDFIFKGGESAVKRFKITMSLITRR